MTSSDIHFHPTKKRLEYFRHYFGRSSQLSVAFCISIFSLSLCIFSSLYFSFLFSFYSSVFFFFSSLYFPFLFSFLFLYSSHTLLPTCAFSSFPLSLFLCFLPLIFSISPFYFPSFRFFFSLSSSLPLRSCFLRSHQIPFPLSFLLILLSSIFISILN